MYLLRRLTLLAVLVTLIVPAIGCGGKKEAEYNKELGSPNTSPLPKRDGPIGGATPKK